MTYHKADGSQLISGGHVLITEIVVMKVERKQFAHLSEANNTARKNVIKERHGRNL